MKNEDAARALYQRDIDHARETESDFRWIVRIAADIRGTAYRLFVVPFDDLPQRVKRRYMRLASN
jgi:hypothetical protein